VKHPEPFIEVLTSILSPYRKQNVKQPDEKRRTSIKSLFHFQAMQKSGGGGKAGKEGGRGGAAEKK